MDFEGIYRKSGGTALAKEITMLFERGEPFDLDDSDRFNDIGAVTSVLKNYFRGLPTPLMTYALHDEWLTCIGGMGGTTGSNSLSDTRTSTSVDERLDHAPGAVAPGAAAGEVRSCDNRSVDTRVEDFRGLLRRLPAAHYHTLQYLALHLFHVHVRVGENRMSAMNLGVVFGPTLLRSPDPDPSKEFTEMGPKARVVEYCITHPELFEGIEVSQ